MNKLRLLSLIAILSLSAHADVKPSLNSALAAKRLLTDIVKVNDTLVTVGERGHILLSKDGHDWQQASVPINVLLTDVFFLDQQHGWAVGHDASILFSEDGGLNWSIQHYDPALDKPLFNIHFTDSNNGIAIGAYGLFMRTGDGGKHWQLEFHDEFLNPDDRDYLNSLKADDPKAYQDETRSILPHFNRLLVRGKTIYLVGEIGLFAHSEDYGKHWQKVDAFYNGSFFDIAAVNDQQILVAGLRGNLFSSQDRGQQWQRIPLVANTSINRIIVTEKTVVLLGNSGLLQVSKDGGLSFTSHNQSDGKAITAGAFVADKLILSSEVGIKILDVKSLAGGR